MFELRSGYARQRVDPCYCFGTGVPELCPMVLRDTCGIGPSPETQSTECRQCCCWCPRLPTSPGSGRPYRPRRLLHSRYQQSRPHEVSYGNNYLACRSQAARATGKRRQASNGQWFEWARTFPAWQIAQSPKVDVLFVAPGAGGNKDPAPNINIPDYTAVIATAQELAIDPVVIGPDSPGKQLGNQAGWD